MAISEGITHVVATPHADGNFHFDFDLVQKRRAELQARVGDRLQLATGCDFHLNVENLRDIRPDPSKYSLNQKRYLLVEFADFAIPPTAEEALHQLQLLGLSSIVTHPERNALIRLQPQRLLRWIRARLLRSGDRAIAAWKMGRQRETESGGWLDQQMVHFFASDAHNTDRRPLRLKEARDMVAERWGENLAQSLFQDNPLAAFEGRDLPYQPRPESAGGGMAHSPPRRKRFIFF